MTHCLYATAVNVVIKSVLAVWRRKLNLSFVCVCVCVERETELYQLKINRLRITLA